jgi:hypothetical protein
MMWSCDRIIGFFFFIRRAACRLILGPPDPLKTASGCGYNFVVFPAAFYLRANIRSTQQPDSRQRMVSQGTCDNKRASMVCRKDFQVASLRNGEISAPQWFCLTDSVIQITLRHDSLVLLQ